MALAAAFAFAPFVARPLFVDDHAHFMEALTLRAHWLEPYGSQAGLLGWGKGAASPSEANPLFYFYLVAGLSRIFGQDLWKYHVIFMAANFGALVAFYSIAQRLTRYPLWASLLWLVSPHFWLTANSLLVDALIAPIMMGGLALWIKSGDEGQALWAWPASVLLALAPLVKYTAILAWALAVLWSLLHPRKRSYWLPLGLTPLLLGGWTLWTTHYYGSGHLLATARASMVLPSGARVLSLLIFAAGTTSALWLVLILVAHRRRFVGGVLILSGFILGVAFYGWGGIGLQAGIWLAIFLGAGDAFWPLPSRRPVTLFVLAWVAAGLLELLIARDWVCGRYFVIVGPALVLLTLQAFESHGILFADSQRFQVGTVGAFALIGALLAISDYQQASIDAITARTARALAAGRTIYYPEASLGGISYYLGNGGQGLPPGASVPKKGLVLLPTRTLPRHFLPRIERGRILRQMTYSGILPFRTLDIPSGAGFYGSVWAPLPFSFSRAPVETYFLAISHQ